MKRRLPLLLLLLAAACGGEEPAPAPEPEPVPRKAPETFSVTVTASSAPGARPAIRVRGPREGVTLRISRVTDPVPLLLDPELPDPADAELVLEFPAGRRPPRLEAGLYLVETAGAPEATRARILVTDLALVAKRSCDELLVFAADAASGLPVPAAKIAVKSDGIVEGDVADAQGVFRGSAPPGPLRIVVESEGRLAVVSVPEVPAAEDPTPFALFDRPAARPGEMLRFKTLVRPDEVRLTDRRGVVIAPDRFIRASTGSAWGRFRLPRSFAAGPARLTIVVGDETHDLPVGVLPVERPPVSLTVAPDARVVARGRPVGFSIRAWDGGDLTGTRVHYRVERISPPAEEPVLEGRGALDAFGGLEGSFVPEGAGGYRIRVELPGPGSEAAEASTDLTVLPATVVLDLDTSRRFFLEGETPFVRVRASFPAGARTRVEGTVRAGGREHPFEIPGTGEAVAEVAIGPLEPGRHEVTAAATDPDGRPATAGTETLVGVDAVDEDDLLVLPERLVCVPGEPTRALVLLPVGYEGATLLATIEGRRLGNHEIVAASGRRAILRFDAPRRPGSRMAVRVAAFRAGATLEGGAEIRVSARQERLVLRLRAEPPEPRPGEPVELTIGAAGTDGEWASARAAVLVRSAGGRPVPDLAAHLHPDLGPAVATAFFPDERGIAPEDRADERAEAAVEDAVVVAGWSPHVFLPGTPETAKLPIVLPSAPTAWEVTAVARIGDRAGSGSLTIRTRMPHRLELPTPPFLVAGDAAPVEVLLANRTESGLEDTLSLTADGLAIAGEASFEVSADPGGMLRRTFRLEAIRAGRFRLAATLTGAGLVKGRGLRVYPRGVERRLVAAGTLEPGRTVVPLDLPPGVSPRDARLRVSLRLGTEGVLAAETDAAGTGPPEAALSLLVRDILARRGEDEPAPDAEEPLTRFADLWAHQGPDGAFARWPDGTADRGLTAVVVALGDLARQAGIELDGERLGRAKAYLSANVPDEDPVGRAAEPWAALALAESGREWGPAELRIRDSLLRAETHGPARFLVLPALAAAPPLGGGEAAAIRVRAGNGIAASVMLEALNPAEEVRVPATLLTPGRNVLVFEASGSPHVLYRAELVYRVRGGAEGTGLPFRIRRELQHVDAGPPRSPIGTVRRGAYLRADVTVSAPKPERWVTVECPLPGGARVVTGALPVPEGVRMEVREDRIVFRLAELGLEPVVLPVLLRAVHPGRFTLRPAEVYAEDDPARRADTGGLSLTIE